MAVTNARERAYLDHVATLPCSAPGCHVGQVEVAHVAGAVSAKTGLRLPRRSGPAYLVVVPLCATHHRTGADSVHALGERGWERHHGLPEGHLLGVAAQLLASYVGGR